MSQLCSKLEGEDLMTLARVVPTLSSVALILLRFGNLLCSFVSVPT